MFSRTPVYNGAIILMSRLHYNTILGANEAIEGHDSVAVAMELSLKVNNDVKYIMNSIFYSTAMDVWRNDIGYSLL